MCSTSSSACPANKLHQNPHSNPRSHGDNNDVTTKQQEAEIHMKIKDAKSSQLLMLSNTNLKHANRMLESLPCSLKHLYVSNCHFSGEIPEVIFKLSLLETLDISKNHVMEIPSGVFEKLRKLVTLDCSCNKLISIMPLCWQLENLQELNLASNKIICLPQTLGELSKLKILNLSNNLLREIPGAIFAGPMSRSLVRLEMEHNLLVTLPPEIGSLTSLQELNIKNNCFKYLPANARNLRKLSAFHHSGNDWLICPPHVKGVPSQMQSSYGTAALEKLYTYIYPP